MADTLPARSVIIIGAASAMAEHTARQLAAQGARLALVARDAGRLETLAADLTSRGAAKTVTRALDLLRVEDPAALIDALKQELGELDSVLIFHGYLGDQAKAETDIAEARRILTVNFNSAAELSLAAANILETSAHPRPVLLAIGSVAGDRGRASNFVYGAAKGGLAVLYQGLAHRFGAGSKVRAVVIKCGFVDTPMTAGFPKGGPLWATPEQVAKVIVGAMERGGPIVYAPWFWRFVMLIIRLLPQPIMNRVKL
jgi:short-subunit dehydrogenase